MARKPIVDASYFEHPAKISVKELKTNSRAGYRFIKRTFDILFSSAVLIILAPLYGIIALAIKIDDPSGPIIFSQRRCGRGGKIFKMHKFRTMHPNADKMLEQLKAQNEMSGPAFKMRNDPRITRVGKFLRATSLDELPQFINIFKGEMSVVGPRPPIPSETAIYDEYQYQRLFVTPGITCYWQIMPNRNDITFDQWLQLDIKYVVERSVKVDLKIIWGTVLRVLSRDGR